MRSEIEIGGRRIGDEHPAYLISEVGLAHEGSLGMAHSFIDAAADSGVDAVKFQTHLASEESTIRESFRVKVFPQDKTRFDYWIRTAFSLEQWKELADHTREKGLAFLSSPFSNLAADYLIECDVPAWKIASGELTNLPLLEKVADTGKPVLLSSGMSSWRELDRAVEFLQVSESEVAVLQCTTAYPCPPAEWGLNLINEMRNRYVCPVGFSDHSGTIAASLSAHVLGASLLEFHVTFSKKQFGPDVAASLTFEQAAQLVSCVRDIEVALLHPIDKDAQAEKLKDLHVMFTKSIVASTDLPAGTVLTLDHLAFKKPGSGIPSSAADQIVGKMLTRAVRVDEFLRFTDFS